MCLKFQLSAGARLAQSVERKALNLVVVSSSHTVGVAAEPTQGSALWTYFHWACTHWRLWAQPRWSCLGFPYPHQTSTNIWKRLQRKISERGVAQWLACWAHNPKVPGLKPGSAMHVLSQAWPVLWPQSLLKLAPFLKRFLKGRNSSSTGQAQRKVVT